ncbi:MAG: hypothetical protein JXR51_05530 [Bacteroidales bacterium]|nr:hypothetical protein [Bacteroidales bacterium]
MFRFKNIQFYLLVGFISSLLLVNCNNDENGTDESEQIDSSLRENPTLVKVNNRLFSVPSPFQVSVLVKNNKIPYNKKLLNPISNQTNYSTNFKQALNLGVYGADLSYLNIYEQLPDAAAYFAVVKVLSKELGIISTLDQKTIKRIEDNNNNKDSLLLILSNIYRDADAYLFNNDRNEIGLLILSGGWIESLYVMTKILDKYNNQDIINRIGEQKYPLDNLIELLRPYYGNISDEFDGFLEELVDLATIFDGVVIQYTFEEPIVDVNNKLTTINSKTKTIINDYQLQKISENITKMRAKIIE